MDPGAKVFVYIATAIAATQVADKGEVAENRDRPNVWNWATSLREAASKIGKELRMKNSLNANTRSGINTMAFYESILVCLTKYAELNGRASRSEFWWFTLLVLLVASALVDNFGNR